MRRRKLRKNVFVLLGGVVVLGAVLFFAISKDKDIKKSKVELRKITDFENLKLSEVKDYAMENGITLDTKYCYDDKIEKDKVIRGSISSNKLEVLVSLGNIPIDKYRELKVNELGNVPIMMYHGIENITNNKYTGGNIDKDGYNRTSKAFREDLEFYYENNYRMIRLEDYINGKIDVELGYSPIILTFDDGNANNFKVLGRNSDGSLKFDPNSAIGILESIKEKYSDYNVTATFFLNNGLCNQPEYNEEIMKWLIDHGYDIGNHTTNHSDFSKIDTAKTQEIVGKMYQKLDSILKDKYVKIVALPFGSPYVKTHNNYQYIIKGSYENYEYQSEALLRVGWEPEVSPFNSSFDKEFLKRCRAYDNNGKEFDIKMTFDILEKNRYISDGMTENITIPKSVETNINDYNLKVMTYEEG